MKHVAWIRNVLKQVNIICEDPMLISRVSLVLNSLEIDIVPWAPTVEYMDDCIDITWSHLHPSITLHIGHTSYNSSIMCLDDNMYLSRTVELNINNARFELCATLDQIACRWSKA